MYYQECCQMICHLLGWDYLGNRSKGIGIFGKCIAFVRTDKEQGREMLHGHWLVWIEGFDKLQDDLFSSDPESREYARNRLKKYMEKTFCSDYQYSNELAVTHPKCNATGEMNDVVYEHDDQVLRDCRFKEKCKEVKGEVMACSYCATDNGI